MTAVIVAHDGAAWLPEVLAALDAQTVPPARLVAVDTGSRDGSAALLRDALGDAAVLELPRETGYPEAVRAGLRHAAVIDGKDGADGYLWLLHDDAAPDPDCLERLLVEAGRQPSAGLLGPKAVDWHDPRVLVEVGVTTDRAGHRTTGLERGEQDQGQHDAVRDVLAVGTAGALARREVWDEVSGLDPVLPLFRDELDLGWRTTSAGSRVVVVPAARVRHVRAATTGRREPGAVRGPAARHDRRHAVFVLLAHASRRRLLLAVPALVLGSVLRSIGFLLLRRVAEARDELGALGAVLGHPRRLTAARRRRRGLRTVPPAVVRPLLATRTARLRSRAESLGGWLAGAAAPARGTGSALGDPGPDGPDDDDLGAGAPGLLRTVLARPPVLLVLALALLALLAERRVLSVSGGLLSGGRLLPPPDGAADLWAAWTSSWSSAGLGTPAAAPPWVAVLAGLSSVLLGKPWLAVDLLLLASVPLAGLTAYLAARRAVASPALRLWAAAVWALLPVATGAVAAGRLDAAAVQITLPLLGLSMAHLLEQDPRGSWHRAWGTGLLLAVTASLAPTLWLVAAPLLVVAAALALAGAPRALRPAARRRALAALLVAGLPVLLLLPWSLGVLRTPGLLLHGPGRLALDPALADPALPAWHLPLLSPGGAGLPPLWVTAGLLLAALGGLVRSHRRRTAGTAWTVALGALAAALVLTRVAVPAPAGGPELPVWPGAPLQVAAACLLLAALVAGDGLRERLARTDFGWRQPAAAAVAALAAVVPLLAAVGWVVRGADDPLDRRPAEVVPAFVTAELAGDPGVRVLVLQARGDGSVGYEVQTADGVRLGAADLPPPADQAAALGDVVADLVTARGSAAAEALATRAVRYVALPGADVGSPLAAVLDAQTGLSRRSAEPVPLWQVQAPAAHLSVLSGPLAEAAAAGVRGPSAEQLRASPPQVLPSGRVGARTAVPDGEGDRLLVLAEARDAGWWARLDGEPLEPATAWGWAQAFVLPPGDGQLVLDRDDRGRALALALQAVAVLVVAVLSVPGGRRRDGLEPSGGVVAAAARLPARPVRELRS
ncbi:MAG TPA: glycosyltransferase family 2 protein [Mycobacteriales bacterium]|nr:glycosyltransferase family 2 protein [Mycobacteriales bacterium]